MDFDLIIVGAGLAGLSLAASLRSTSLRIALADTRAISFPDGWDNRLYAISPTSQRFLADIGAWQHLDATRITPVYAMEITGDAGGRLDLSAYDAGVPELASIVEQSLLQRELWETVKRQSNVSLFCPIEPARLTIGPDAATLTLADERVLTTRLMVGADGAQSWVRQQAGISVSVWDYHARGVVANFATERPHHGSACQWFRPDGVLAYLPLPGQAMSMVWSTPDAHADALLQLSPDALAHTVAQAGGHRLGALTLSNTPAAFPLRLQRVSHCVAPRVALVGDAAHTVHPLAGHGANLGFQDVRVLRDVLLGAAPGQDVGDAMLLRRFERARAEPVALMQSLTHNLTRLFGSNQAILAPLRNAGLRLLNHAWAAPARSVLVRAACSI